MASLLPASVRPPPPDVLLAVPDGCGFALFRRGAGQSSQPAGRLDPDSPLPTMPLILALDEERLLHRTFVLPAAAEPRLRDVVKLDLDRRTPLRADQAFFAVAVTGRMPEAREIAVRVTLLPRAAVAPHLDRLRELGIDPAGIEVTEPGTPPVAMPLGDERPAISRTGRGISRRAGLLVAGVLCLALAPIVWRGALLAMAEREAAALAGDNAGLLAEGEAVANLRRSVLQAMEAKRAAPSTLVVLEALSRLVPDGTWLVEIRFDNGTIELIGLTGDSASLVPLIEASPHFEGARYRSALVRDPGGLDRFHITATVVPHAVP